MLSTLFGMVMVSRLVQLEKELVRRFRFSGRTTSFNNGQSLKLPVISVTVFGMTIFVSLSQPAKDPIDVTVGGMVTDVSSVCPTNDCSGLNLVTVYSTPW